MEVLHRQAQPHLYQIIQLSLEILMHKIQLNQEIINQGTLVHRIHLSQEIINQGILMHKIHLSLDQIIRHKTKLQEKVLVLRFWIVILSHQMYILISCIIRRAILEKYWIENLKIDLFRKQNLQILIETI